MVLVYDKSGNDIDILQTKPHVQGVRLNHAIFASEEVIFLDWE
jgi:hypothetical protein